MWSSNRYDSFEVYYIPAGQTVNGTEILLEGITGGTVTLDYYSDTKTSGSIEFTEFNPQKQKLLKNAHVRIYYLPNIAGKTHKIELCTGYVTSTQLHYENNTTSGTIEFRGELLRFTADKLINTWTIKKGTGTLDYYKAFNNVMGNAVFAWENMPNLYTKWDMIVEIGATPMTVLQRLADYTGCEVVDDTHGRVVMRQYITPGNKPISYTFPTGEQDIIYGGIDIEDNANGIFNRFVLYHTWTDDNSKEHMLRGIAQLPTDNALSAQNQNRWITEVESLDKLEPKTQAKINQLAATRLKKATEHTVKYTFNSFYAPIKYGQVIRFNYAQYTIDAIVEKIEIALVPGATMTVTAREVRKYG